MKKGSNPKKLSAFDKIRAGLEDAIAYQRGQRTLTAREVEFRPLPKLGAREVAKVRAHLRVSQVASPGCSTSARAPSRPGRATPERHPTQR